MNERSDDIEALYKNAPRSLEQPSRHRALSPFLLVVCLIIGLGGGIVGALFTGQYLAFSDLFNPGGSATVGVVTGRTKGETFDRTALQRTSRALLSLYPLADATGTAADALSEADRLGSALLLTDDGLAVTDAAVLAEDAVVAVTYDKKAYRVRQVTRDPASGLVYFRIDGTRVPTAEFVTTNALTTLTSAVVLAGTASETATRAEFVRIDSAGATAAEPLQSPETLAASIALDRALPTAFLGGVLVDEKGRVEGIISKERDGLTRVWPSEAITAVLEGLVRDETVARPVLGITFIDLATTAGVPDAIRQNRKTGALLAGDDDRPAVSVGSPAAKAGLKADDIIIAIGDLLLTEYVRVPETIAAYEPGEQVTVRFVRNGEEDAETITLGTHDGSD